MLNAVLFVFSIGVFAQKDVTKFLGIPVDGTKSEMIQKLKAKGFQYDASRDYLTGEFNGRSSELIVATNNNKVWRIMVRDAFPSNESNIKIKFNHLYRQFEKNEKYIHVLSDQTIPDEENISHQMTIYNKRYEASFYQLPVIEDSLALAEELRSLMLTKYTEEQLANPTEDIQSDIVNSSVSLFIEKCSNKSVWFMIDRQYNDYYLLLFYDNEYNHSDGEDL